MVIQKVDFIAEIGINHNGDFDLARKHIDAAKDAGATTVKMQNYYAETRVAKDSPIFSILEDCELPPEKIYDLKLYSESLNINFASTPFCTKSAKDLISMGCETIKVASFHLNDKELLKSILEGKDVKTMILSTGASKFSEIENANNFYESFNSIKKPELFILHCISQYPVGLKSDCHLSTMLKIREKTGKQIGFSDHTLGHEVAVNSIFCGAKIIEKHFTIDNSLGGADHAMSANPETFKKLVDACTNALEIFGTPRENSSFNCEADIVPYKRYT